MPGISDVRVWWAGRPPAAGAAVLATGLLSVGLQAAGVQMLSRVALVLAWIAWAALVADVALRLLGQRHLPSTYSARTGAFTAVTATTVLGTRIAMLGRPSVAEALLALAVLLWVVVMIVAVRHRRRRWTQGALGAMATQGLAVLAATLAAAEQKAWLAHSALVLFWLALVLGGRALARLDARQVREGAGEQWIAAGLVAVSAWAGATLLIADGTGMHLWNDDDRGVLRVVTVGLLVLTSVFFLALLAAEAARPRPHYDVRRWATVFSVGMTAAALLSAATALDVSWLRQMGLVLLWTAVAAWLAVAAGAVLALWDAWRKMAEAQHPTAPRDGRSP
ncbi:hypothetical protein ACFVJ4_40255 [Streptomyces sp. NPDC127178]|uniref:SLAC1 family transporter n=1 Tax=unclassified Streptomyces TaxID=2593676 RepID=UPI003631D4B1